MLVAAAMGAIAFQKDLGVVHSLAHPLSTICGMHHGLANALNLVSGMQFCSATQARTLSPRRHCLRPGRDEIFRCRSR